MTQKEIDKIANEPLAQAIINSEDFYFRKGQDALKKWLSMEVDGVLRTKLLELCKDYPKIQSEAGKDPHIREILELLFEITSYCDSKAKDKDGYNKYEDKRTLARASVRMNSWIEHLVFFKFDPSVLKRGSTTNAFNYLLKPENEVTALSENHRQSIAENFLNTEYNPSTFVRSVREYFAPFGLKTKNSSNYTQLLSRIIYSVSKKWKDEVIGLMASDGTGWQDEYVKSMKDFDACIIWNTKRPTGTNNTTKFLKNTIAEGGSFPLFYSSKGYVTYKAEIIDFAENQNELDARDWEKGHRVFNFHRKFSDYKDSAKSASIVFLARSIEKVNSISVNEFEFYKNYNPPRQDNLSPIKQIPAIASDDAQIPFPPEGYLKQDVEDYIRFCRNIVKEFKLKKGDERLVFSIRENNLNFILGQRYCWNLYQINEKGKFGAISAQPINATSEGFKGTNGPPFYTNFSQIDLVESNKESIYEAIERELERARKSSFLKYNDKHFENYVFNSSEQNHKFEKMNLNQILFGPPGTGKTYDTINKAIKMLNPGFDISQSRDSVKSEFQRLEKKGQVFFTTFHQSMSYEDFVEGIKPLPPARGEKLSYDIVSGIFKRACALASYYCSKATRIKPGTSSTVRFDDLYGAFVSDIQDRIKKGHPPVYKTVRGKDVEVKEVNRNFSIIARAKNSIATSSAPLTKTNLKKLYDRFPNISDINGDLSLVQETVEVTPRITEFYAVFSGLKEFEKTYRPDVSTLDNLEQIQAIDYDKILSDYEEGAFHDAVKERNLNAEPVVFIIDEINRGNVSQIFGELITLLEDDKRQGRKESLEITLPYSKMKFGVPQNLFVIGTMNTADRSVEALDTALRRRFSFEEMPPKYNLKELVYEYAGFKAFEILRMINRRIEKLVDKDHQIGHSYFMRQEGESPEQKLVDAFYSSIIPLLQEYFFGDYGKIGLVLGPGFVAQKDEDEEEGIFADFDHDSVSEFEAREVFAIVDYRKKETDHKFKNTQLDFGKAIKLLMKQEIA